MGCGASKNASESHAVSPKEPEKKKGKDSKLENADGVGYGVDTASAATVAAGTAALVAGAVSSIPLGTGGGGAARSLYTSFGGKHILQHPHRTQMQDMIAVITAGTAQYRMSMKRNQPPPKPPPPPPPLYQSSSGWSSHWWPDAVTSSWVTLTVQQVNRHE